MCAAQPFVRLPGALKHLDVRPIAPWNGHAIVNFNQAALRMRAANNFYAMMEGRYGVDTLHLRSPARDDVSQR